MYSILAPFFRRESASRKRFLFFLAVGKVCFLCLTGAHWHKRGMYKKKDYMNTKSNRENAKERYYILKCADSPLAPLVIAIMEVPHCSFDLCIANIWAKKKLQRRGGAVSTQKEKREYVHKIEKMGEKKAEFPCSGRQYFAYFPVGSDHFGCPNFPC